MTRPSDTHPTAEGLRPGFTTGTCAAAAAKAAALALHGVAASQVEVALPSGDEVLVPVARAAAVSSRQAYAAVVKDAGDDPDITNGMTVEVTLEVGGTGVRFAAGAGVGTITRAGLQLDPGEPAINPVPRAMIAAALADVLGDAGALVTVSVPGGEEVAEKTFGPRLGIEGGISIIGTTGRVEPKSTDA